MNSNIASFGFIECCQDGKWTRQLRVKLSVHSYKQHSFRCVPPSSRAIADMGQSRFCLCRFDLNLPSHNENMADVYSNPCMRLPDILFPIGTC